MDEEYLKELEKEVIAQKTETTEKTFRPPQNHFRIQESYLHEVCAWSFCDSIF